MWPATPWSNPNRENRRKDAASRSFRCCRSWAGLENVGGSGLRNGATREAIMEIIMSAYRFPVKLLQAHRDQQHIEHGKRRYRHAGRNMRILRDQRSTQSLARVDQRIEQHQLLQQRKTVQHGPRIVDAAEEDHRG